MLFKESISCQKEEAEIITGYSPPNVERGWGGGGESAAAPSWGWGGWGAGSHPGGGLARSPRGLPTIREQREKDAGARTAAPLSPALVGWICHLWVPLEASSGAGQLAASPSPTPVTTPPPPPPRTPPCSGSGVNCQALPSDPSVGFSLVWSLSPQGVQRGPGVGGGGSARSQIKITEPL